jgi:hypothetical protein
MSEPPTPTHVDDPGPPGPQKDKRTVDQGVAIIIAAAIGVLSVALGIVGTWWLLRPSATSGQASPGPTVTVFRAASPSPTAQPTHLRFSLHAHSRVPWCEVYEGIGSIPRGEVLAIFTTPADQDGNPSNPPDWSLNYKATQLGSNSWQTEPLQIGPEGANDYGVDIVGVLISSSTFAYISSVSVKPINNVTAPWVTRSLLPGLEVNLPVITNGQRGLNCH